MSAVTSKRLNWLDFLLIVCFIGVVALFVSGNRIIQQPHHPLAHTQIDDTVDVTCKFDFLSHDTASLIQPGDIYFDQAGRTIAKLIKVSAPQPVQPTIQLGNNHTVSVQANNPERLEVYVLLRLYGHYNQGNRKFLFQSQPLGENFRIVFKTDKYKIFGVIIKPEQVTQAAS